jgi:hypothetical protein
VLNLFKLNIIMLVTIVTYTYVLSFYLWLLQVFDNIRVFSNLTHVQLVYYTDVDWHLFFDVLKKCPKLQNFDLDTPTPPYYTSNFPHISGPSNFPQMLNDFCCF